MFAQYRANNAISEYLKEIFNPPFLINESTFDETRDSAIECAKQNIEESKLSDKEKEHVKMAVEKTVQDIAQMFKVGMKQSGRLV